MNIPILITPTSHKMAVKTLSAIIFALWCGGSYAASEQPEVEALRQEVRELKQLVQALSAQQNSPAIASQSSSNATLNYQPSSNPAQYSALQTAQASPPVAAKIQAPTSACRARRAPRQTPTP